VCSLALNSFQVFDTDGLFDFADMADQEQLSIPNFHHPKSTANWQRLQELLHVLKSQMPVVDMHYFDLSSRLLE
jgi:hypothetical protein